MKQIAAIILFLFFAITGFSQENIKDYSEAFKLAGVWLEAQKDYENLPGISYAVIKDQQTLWKGAYGYANPEKGVKAGSSTL